MGYSFEANVCTENENRFRQFTHFGMYLPNSNPI